MKKFNNYKFIQVAKVQVWIERDNIITYVKTIKEPLSNNIKLLEDSNIDEITNNWYCESNEYEIVYDHILLERIHHDFTINVEYYIEDNKGQIIKNFLSHFEIRKSLIFNLILMKFWFDDEIPFDNEKEWLNSPYIKKMHRLLKIHNMKN